MSRTYTVTEYDKDDIEKLESMTTKEVIEILEHIERGWMPQDYVYGPVDSKTYSESQYEATKLHIALNKAISIIEQYEGKEKK